MDREQDILNDILKVFSAQKTISAAEKAADEHGHFAEQPRIGNPIARLRGDHELPPTGVVVLLVDHQSCRGTS